VRRILSTGSLLLALTGAAWTMPSCAEDDTPAPVDGGYVGVDTTLRPPPDASPGPDNSGPPPADASTIDAYAPDTSAAPPDASEP
jgi:hypothetical protein